MDDEIKAQLIDLAFAVGGAFLTALIGLLAQLARKANALLDHKLQAGEFAKCQRLAGKAFDDRQRQSTHEAKAAAAQRIWGQSTPRKRSFFRPRNREDKLKAMVEEAVEKVARRHLVRGNAQVSVTAQVSQGDDDVQS